MSATISINMRNLFLSVVIALLLLATKAGDLWAQESKNNFLPQYLDVQNIQDEFNCYQSLTLTVLCGSKTESTKEYLSTADKIMAAANDERVRKLRAYFAKHNSPLEPYAYDFVYYADLYGLDWKLVPAITGVESTFGKRIPKNSYNAYGWANGAYAFTSWEQSIEHVTRTLKTKYYDRGLTTVPKIARVYAPPSNTWGNNVLFFMGKIETFEPEL